jgi:hypothetical protein
MIFSLEVMGGLSSVINITQVAKLTEKYFYFKILTFWMKNNITE